MENSLYILVLRLFQILGLDIKDLPVMEQGNKPSGAYGLCSTRQLQDGGAVDKRSDSVLWCARGSVDRCGDLCKSYGSHLSF